MPCSLGENRKSRGPCVELGLYQWLPDQDSNLTNLRLHMPYIIITRSIHPIDN